MIMNYQKLVNDVVARAKTTNCGLRDEPHQSLRIKDTYGEVTAETAAMCLVNAFHAKYDFVSIIQATIEVMHNAARTDSFSGGDGCREAAE